MADTKITALTALTGADPANDVIPIVDVSDTTMAASGTTKKISVNNILGASGTATLASATITGDLTVDTSTLKVDSGANKVGFGTTTMNGVLTVKNTSVLSDIPIYTIQGATNTAQLASWTINQNTDVISFGTDYGGALSLKTNSTERYRLASDGVATWSNVGGVAGTAMTLNSTGLGVGIAPDATKSTRLSVYQTGDLTDETAPLSVGNTAAGGMRLYAGVNNTNEYVYIGSVKSGTGYRSLILQPNGGNVGIGITSPSYLLHTSVPTGGDRNMVRFQVSGASSGLTITWNNGTQKMRVNFGDLPTSSAGLPANTLWVDTAAGNTLKLA